MQRLQAPDPLEAWKNHPEEARALSDLIAEFSGFIFCSLLSARTSFSSEKNWTRRRKRGVRGTRRYGRLSDIEGTPNNGDTLLEALRRRRSRIGL
jgi:hypothetical protein